MTTIEYSDALADFMAAHLGVPESEEFRDTVGLAVDHLNDEAEINEAIAKVEEGFSVLEEILPGSVRRVGDAVVCGPCDCDEEMTDEEVWDEANEPLRQGQEEFDRTHRYVSGDGHVIQAVPNEVTP